MIVYGRERNAKLGHRLLDLLRAWKISHFALRCPFLFNFSVRIAFFHCFLFLVRSKYHHVNQGLQLSLFTFDVKIAFVSRFLLGSLYSD